ncbi:MAG: metal-dependent hydrolase [Gammaproteobacteria bacterium]|nr:metal-dependent hydrolase [Gammaproteobacteria bacterium]
MDSVSQFALGSAIGVAVMGRRTAVWKAALWGGLAGTLPDLDALIDFGDVVSNMVRHRAESHGLFYLSLAAPVVTLLPTWIHGERALYKRWLLAMWLALFTHPLLDWFTIYGTQLMQPFSDSPLGLGSMFIIDPLYTLPLLVGIIAALTSKRFGLRTNTIALAFSCTYLAWSVVAQQHVLNVVREQLKHSAQPVEAMFATPAPLNTILWRIVVLRGDKVEEGFYSFFDKERHVKFDTFPRGLALATSLADNQIVKRMTTFTDGFVAIRENANNKAVLSDLRMGQEPHYVFSFTVATRANTDAKWVEINPESVGSRGDTGKALRWLWQRMWGEDIPPPR